MFSHTLSTQNNAFGALIGVTECNDITITKCAAHGAITVTNSIYGVGGIIGYTNSAISSINNCWSYCTITSSKQDCYVGGLAGYLACGSVYNCGNFEGTIKSTANAGVGGLFGYASGASTYSKCFNQAKVESNGGPVGGLIGKLNTSNVQVNDCYNNANLSCNNGSVIGGLVGSSASGLSFNRCYSNGELKRSNVSANLSQVSTYTNKEIASYKVYGDFSGKESGWDYNCNINFGIQNGGGDDTPINTIHVGISKVEKASTTSIVYSNLCGNSASYNSSFCRNTYDFGYDSTNGIPIIKIQTKFTYNSNTSHVLERLTLRSVINSKYVEDNDFEYQSLATSGYTLVCDGDNEYLLDYLHSNNMKATIKDGKDGYRRTAYYFEGFKYEINDSLTKLTIYPQIFYWCNSDRYPSFTGRLIDESHYVTIDLPSVGVTNNTSLVGNTSDIKLETLGSAFTTASGRNGDMPILKDFYWEYN